MLCKKTDTHVDLKLIDAIKIKTNICQRDSLTNDKVWMDMCDYYFNWKCNSINLILDEFFCGLNDSLEFYLLNTFWPILLSCCSFLYRLFEKWVMSNWILCDSNSIILFQNISFKLFYTISLNCFKK